MTNKVIVIPEEVRGGGNIVSPHEVLDYSLVDSVLSSSSETVDGVTTTVYCLNYNGSVFTVSVSPQYVASGSTVTVTVLLKDENGDPVEGASIELFKEVSS